MIPLRSIFSAGIFFASHLALVAYINSSMLALHIAPSMLALIFGSGACISLLLLWKLPTLIQRYGLMATASTLLSINASLLLSISLTVQYNIVLLLFALYISTNASIVYCFDLFIEHYASPHHIGKIRGAYLSLTNGIWIAAAFSVAALIASYGFSFLYRIAAVMVALTATVLSIGVRHFRDVPYTQQAISPWQQLLNSSLLRRITAINFMLQLFYVWMVIYGPLFLLRTIGLSWHSMGIAFGIMLIAFAITQYPAGRLADYIGEKKLLSVALLICGSSTMAFAYFSPRISFVGIVVVLFCTRIGAALLEVSCDSYFFKHAKETEVGTVSIYRMITPLAFIIGASFGGLLLYITNSYASIFITLGILCFSTLWYVRRLPR